jgi:hypothetical protein
MKRIWAARPGAEKLRLIAALALTLLAIGGSAMYAHSVDRVHSGIASYESDVTK